MFQAPGRKCRTLQSSQLIRRQAPVDVAEREDSQTNLVQNTLLKEHTEVGRLYDDEQAKCRYFRFVQRRRVPCLFGSMAAGI